MKVSELTGPLLDYWTGEAGDLNPVFRKKGKYADGSEVFRDYVSLPRVGLYSPSTDWSQGGPIIEREIFALVPVMGGTWCAERNIPTGGDDYEVSASYGKTPLEAAMRCFVASKFGDKVPDE